MSGWVMLAALQIALVGTPDPASQPDATQDWIGSIALPAFSIRTAVHIKVGSHGTLSGTFDSPDQGKFDIPVSGIQSSDSTLAFDIPAWNVHYSAKWLADRHIWDGTWHQRGQSFPLALSKGLFATPPWIKGIDGDWDGVLSTDTETLVEAFHIHSDARSGSRGTLDSISQGSYDIAMSRIARDGDHIRFEFIFGGVFDGRLSADRTILSGHWLQNGDSTPLVIKKRLPGVPQPRLPRPQTPRPPFPYANEQVSFSSSGNRLAGTLTRPTCTGSCPAVVLIAGSGPNDRDETIAGHHPFAVLADYLARHGIAALRFDKRGIGESTGDFHRATTRDFAQDAEAALSYLRSRKDIDARRVGLIGHSEGGLIAPIVASQDHQVAFLVLLSAPGEKGRKILLRQNDLIEAANGRPKRLIKQDIGYLKLELDIARKLQRHEINLDTLRLRIGNHWVPANRSEAVKTTAKAFATDWWAQFSTLDPRIALHAVRCPVLAIWGSKDLQVPSAINLPLVRRAVPKTISATYSEISTLNHMLQPATTGSPREYGSIEETLSPVALDRITTWLLGRIQATPVAPSTGTQTVAIKK